MNNKPSITYLILIIAPLFFGCGGTVTKENKNNVSASSLSLHVGNEKYFIIDTKETVVAWTGARIEVKSGIVEANGKLVIDRTRWDVRYRSGKFYDNLADKTISDSIEFNIKIVAKK